MMIESENDIEDDIDDNEPIKGFFAFPKLVHKDIRWKSARFDHRAVLTYIFQEFEKMKTKEVIYGNGNVYKIAVGQAHLSERQIVKEVGGGINRWTVRRALKYWEKVEWIKHEPHQDFTLITLTNTDIYNIMFYKSAPPPHHPRTTYIQYRYNKNTCNNNNVYAPNVVVEENICQGQELKDLSIYQPIAYKSESISFNQQTTSDNTCSVEQNPLFNNITSDNTCSVEQNPLFNNITSDNIRIVEQDDTKNKNFESNCNQNRKIIEFDELKNVKIYPCLEKCEDLNDNDKRLLHKTFQNEEVISNGIAYAQSLKNKNSIKTSFMAVVRGYCNKPFILKSQVPQEEDFGYDYHESMAEVAMRRGEEYYVTYLQGLKDKKMYNEYIQHKGL